MLLGWSAHWHHKKQMSSISLFPELYISASHHHFSVASKKINTPQTSKSTIDSGKNHGLWILQQVTYIHANTNTYSNSTPLSLPKAPISSTEPDKDKSVLITGETGERCHDVTKCKQTQWNKSLFVSTRRKGDGTWDHRRPGSFPSDNKGTASSEWRKGLVTLAICLLIFCFAVLEIKPQKASANEKNGHVCTIWKAETTVLSLYCYFWASAHVQLHFKVLIRLDDSHMCLKFSSFVQMVSCVSEARVGCSLMAGDSVQSVLGQNTEPQTTLMHQYVCHKRLYPHTKAVCEWMNIVWSEKFFDW